MAMTGGKGPLVGAGTRWREGAVVVARPLQQDAAQPAHR